MRFLDRLLGRVEPLEGTDSSLWNGLSFPGINEFWMDTFGPASSFISPSLAERVWVANRCMQLNAQQIASMPLRFASDAPAGGYEPAWVANPDPNWYPNGISDAVFSAVRMLYAWGFVCLAVTSRYASGFPQSWTVLDSAAISIDVVNGRRRYKVGDLELDPFDLVQIDRNPGSAVHGSSALAAYATQAWGLLAGSELSRSVLQGGVPRRC